MDLPPPSLRLHPLTTLPSHHFKRFSDLKVEAVDLDFPLYKFQSVLTASRYYTPLLYCITIASLFNPNTVVIDLGGFFGKQKERKKESVFINGIEGANQLRIDLKDN